MSDTLLTPLPNQTEPHQDGGTSRRMVLNMGPQHPSTHGVLRVVLELDGETVMKATPDIGFLHTGIEKQCEALNWAQVTPLTDRVDYLANLSNNLCYALAVENLLGIEAPPKAVFLRVMLTELTRISSHLVWLGTHALDMGAMTMYFLCFREREELLKIFEFFSGQRLMTSYIRIGGLAMEPPRGWEKKVRDFLASFPSKIDEYETLINANPIFLQRTQKVGLFPLADMLELGVTGPLLRAAGLRQDVRKDQPYSGYEKFDFEVPVETENDVYARFRVRMRELRESLKIAQQALDGLPEGSVQSDAPRVMLPQREKMKTQMEALIHHFKIVTEGIQVPEGEIYQVVESPRGELAYFIVSDGTSKPLRLHMRTPSFGNIQALGPMIEGRMLSDVIAIMGSLDFVLGDCDR